MQAQGAATEAKTSGEMGQRLPGQDEAHAEMPSCSCKGLCDARHGGLPCRTCHAMPLAAAGVDTTSHSHRNASRTRMMTQTGSQDLQDKTSVTWVVCCVSRWGRTSAGCGASMTGACTTTPGPPGTAFSKGLSRSAAAARSWAISNAALLRAASSSASSDRPCQHTQLADVHAANACRA